MNLVNNRNITCVEFYLLNALKQMIDIRKLYYKSYISAAKILKEIKDKKEHFTAYSGIERIQNILFRHNMLTYHVSTFFDECDFQKKDLITLLLVNKNFFETQKKWPYREDHYVYIYQTKQGTMMMNSYPVSIEEIKIAKINDFFSHKCLVYQFLNKDHLPFKKVKRLFINYLKKIDFVPIEDTSNLLQLQSFMQILKITRYRLYDLCCYLCANKTLLTTISNATQYYETAFLKISMMLIQKSTSQTTLSEIILKINQFEKTIYQKIRKEYLYE